MELGPPPAARGICDHLHGALGARREHPEAGGELRDLVVVILEDVNFGREISQEVASIVDLDGQEAVLGSRARTDSASGEARLQLHSADVVDESMARHILCVDDVLERAEQEGYEHGVTAGSWLLDGNSSEEAARRLLSGIEDGDPEILDQLPGSPLSGEYADGLLPRDVLAWYDLDEQHDAADDILRAFEDGFSRGVEAEAVRSATAALS